MASHPERGSGTLDPPNVRKCSHPNSTEGLYCGLLYSKQHLGQVENQILDFVEFYYNGQNKETPDSLPRRPASLHHIF